MPPARAFRIHVRAFCVGVAALAFANWLSAGPWWSIWPILAWSIVLGGHYMVFKARTVDDAWVEGRVADLHSKSYDASHIDSIAERHEAGASGAPQDPKPPGQ